MTAPLFDPGRPLHRLHGGIHPDEHKLESAGVPIAGLPLSAQYCVPLVQHTGAPAVPVVAPGDRVLAGQPLGRADGAVSAPVHAPTSGRIVAIEPRPVPHPSGLPAPCIVLEADGDDRPFERQPVADPWGCDPQRLLDAIRAAGIAGMGGAGFPTAVKYGRRAPVGLLIINGTECEPYITSDDRLMQERAARIITGVRLLARLAEPRQVVIAVEDNKPAAAQAMRAALAGAQQAGQLRDAWVASIPTRYPSGGEKQLIQILTGREVPSGGLPIDLGILCQNVGTAATIADAVERGEPLVSRVVTVTGQAVGRPGNRDVRIGTPIADLLAAAALDPGALHRLVMGGPMMGFTLDDPAVPVVKTTNCVIAARARELPEPPPPQACIRCGLCVAACPADLLPQQLYWHARARNLDAAADYNLADCIECGACAWVCPSSIPLVQYFRFAKGEIRNRDQQVRQSDLARERFEQRKARIERQAAEREAAKAARMEAARRKAEAKARTTDTPAPAAEPATAAPPAADPGTDA